VAIITIAHLRERLGAPLYARLTDRTNGTTADDAVAQQLIDEAEAAAQAYLARRFPTPLDAGGQPPAAVLAARVLDLAEYGAWRSSPFVSDPPGRVKALYAEALRWLEGVARGTLDLPAPGCPSGGARSAGAPRVFTAAELDGL
jgi:phage gp36-like protein